MLERTSRRPQSTRNGIVSQKRSWRLLNPNLNEKASLTGYLDEESKSRLGATPYRHNGIIHTAAK